MPLKKIEDNDSTSEVSPVLSVAALCSAVLLNTGSAARVRRRFNILFLTAISASKNTLCYAVVE